MKLGDLYKITVAGYEFIISNVPLKQNDLAVFLEQRGRSGDVTFMARNYILQTNRNFFTLNFQLISEPDPNDQD